MRSLDEQRQTHAKVILQVRGGAATSRRKIADALHISPSTTGEYVDQLLSAGYLVEVGLDRSAMGRPQRLLETVPGVGWFVGVEFNAERIQAVRVDFSGHQQRSSSRAVPEEATAASVLDEIIDLVQELRRGAKGPLLAIGVGAPGIVQPDEGIGLHYAFLPDWKDVPVRKKLEARFNVPVILENNLRVIALAERWFGGGREWDDYVILGPRAGFGIAVVKNGQLIDGQHHAAGEIGRWVWPLGGTGTEMHDVLSAAAVWRRLAGVTTRARLPMNLHEALREFADADDAAWKGVVSDYARVLGLLHLVLDARAYFLHGPLTALGMRFCTGIANEAAVLMPALRDMPPQILSSDLGDDAGALGAASLAMEAWQPEQPLRLNP